jgi:hypothetical protein
MRKKKKSKIFLFKHTTPSPGEEINPLLFFVSKNNKIVIVGRNSKTRNSWNVNTHWRLQTNRFIFAVRLRDNFFNINYT